jgi:chromosome segregation ATPase
MRRLYTLSLGLLLLAVPAIGQSDSKDSKALEALLAEVRLFRQDFETTALATRKIQILLLRLQAQQATVGRVERRLENIHTELSRLEDERAKLAADIKEHEAFIDHSENPLSDRRAAEQMLPQLKSRMESLENQVQAAQGRESDAQVQLRLEQAKLDNFDDELEHLQKTLERPPTMPRQ